VHLRHEFQVDDEKNGWRIFSKPFDKNFYNWQIYFPWEEEEKLIEATEMLKKITDTFKKNGWNQHYIDLIKDTDPSTMRIGLLYDRDPLDPLTNCGPVTFIGDAAHPLSPYKGRGANLAIQGVRTLSKILERELQKGQEIDWVGVNREYESLHWSCWQDSIELPKKC
jgi:2-polyprenyl-6-methoxyphenol hydroxylase-like FAD-dependent oxidoreductase